MRRLLVALVATLLLLTASACGGGDSGTVKDSSGPAPSATKGPVGSAVDFTLVGLVTASGEGGQVATQAATLNDADDVDAFSAQFQTPGLASKLQDLIAASAVPDGKVRYGAVVSVGCTAPSSVTVTQGPSGLLIQAVTGSRQPNIECLVAETTVAVVLVNG